MTKDEIIRMAREAGFEVDEGLFPFEAAEDKYIGTERTLERFAALVAAYEREKRTKELMQLFLDPENQPTQFGTVTLEMYEALENSLMQAALQIEAWQGRYYAKEGELENIKIDLMELWNNRSNDINTTVANLLIKNGMGDV